MKKFLSKNMLKFTDVLQWLMDFMSGKEMVSKKHLTTRATSPGFNAGQPGQPAIFAECMRAQSKNRSRANWANLRCAPRHSPKTRFWKLSSVCLEAQPWAQIGPRNFGDDRSPMAQVKNEKNIMKIHFCFICFLFIPDHETYRIRLIFARRVRIS